MVGSVARPVRADGTLDQSREPLHDAADTVADDSSEPGDHVRSFGNVSQLPGVLGDGLHPGNRHGSSAGRRRNSRRL